MISRFLLEGNPSYQRVKWFLIRGLPRITVKLEDHCCRFHNAKRNLHVRHFCMYLGNGFACRPITHALAQTYKTYKYKIIKKKTFENHTDFGGSMLAGRKTNISNATMHVVI